MVAVTALPALIYWWWNASTPRQRSDYTAYFWTFIIVVGALGILYELITTGRISSPTGYYPGY